MIEQHPRTGIAHHLLHPLLHLRFVAMHGAEAAGGLLLAKRAVRQAFASILLLLAASCAQAFVLLLPPAVKAYHLADGLLFFFDA